MANYGYDDRGRWNRWDRGYMLRHPRGGDQGWGMYGRGGGWRRGSWGSGWEDYDTDFGAVRGGGRMGPGGERPWGYGGQRRPYDGPYRGGYNRPRGSGGWNNRAYYNPGRYGW